MNAADNAAAEVFVRFARPGFHRWPSATGERKYLSNRHRHLFHVEVTVPVSHDDRNVEFHDLLDHCVGVWDDEWANPKEGKPAEFGDMSCEAIARWLLNRVWQRWPSLPFCTVSVAEDGECGATLRGSRTEERDSR